MSEQQYYEELIISAKPHITAATPHTLSLANSSFFTNKNLEFLITGKDLQNIKALYLSASNIIMFDNVTLIDSFLQIKNLSSENLPFSGIIIPIFIYTSKYIMFQLPQIPNTIGFFDIIVENEAGYSKLTSGSYVPFVSSWRGAENMQNPLISGISVTN